MNNIHRIIIGTVLTIIFLVNGTYAYNITGYVNNTNGIGISGITICTYNNGCQKSSTITDGSGYYKITGLNSGTYYVNINISDRDKNYFYKPSKNMLNNIAPNIVSKITVGTTDIKNVNFTKYYITDARSGFKSPMNFNKNNYGFTFGQYVLYNSWVYHPGQDYNSYSNNGSCYNGRRGTPIYTIADGVVVDIRPMADNDICNKNAWGGVVIKHFYKGKAYYSQYGHLYLNNTNPITIGQKAIKGVTLLGYEDSIMLPDKNGKTYVHLHFEIRNAKHPQPYNRNYFNTSKIKYRDNVYKWYEHPDAFIESSGSYTSFPKILADERELPYTGENPLPTRWFSVNDDTKFNQVPTNDTIPGIGFAGHMQYVYTVTGSIPTAWGKWSFYIPKEGDYEISAFIPNVNGESKNATYKVDGVPIYPAINQLGTSNNWIKIGNVHRLIVGNHYVRLDNNVGETGKKLAYDAINITAVGFEYQITTNASKQEGPDISGDRIVWTDYRINGNYDIYMYNISTMTEQRITTNVGRQYGPAISGDRIVWEDGRNGNDDIYMYDLSTNTERQITTNTAYQRNPAISGNRIVWQDPRNGYYNIYMYDLSTNTERQITTNIANQLNPTISGDRIVYQDDRNGNGDVYMYNLSTNNETQITYNTANQWYPIISGDHIVWEDNRNGNNDIYMYDLFTRAERRITTNASSQWRPDISGNRIVYIDNRNGNDDIYMHDISTNSERQITTNIAYQRNPAISGNRIVWEDNRNGNDNIFGNYDIYMYISK